MTTRRRAFFLEIDEAALPEGFVHYSAEHPRLVLNGAPSQGIADEIREWAKDPSLLPDGASQEEQAAWDKRADDASAARVRYGACRLILAAEGDWSLALVNADLSHGRLSALTQLDAIGVQGWHKARERLILEVLSRGDYNRLVGCAMALLSFNQEEAQNLSMPRGSSTKPSSPAVSTSTNSFETSAESELLAG